MATLQEQIAERFLTKLTESENADPAQIDRLRSLLAKDKRPKADDFVKIFTLPLGGDLK